MATKNTIPSALHDELLKLRFMRGLTWKEIANLTVTLKGCKTAHLKPRRIPAADLTRWYLLRVQRVQRQVLADTKSARECAAAFVQMRFSKALTEQLELMKRKVGILREAAKKKNLSPRELRLKLEELYAIR